MARAHIADSSLLDRSPPAQDAEMAPSRPAPGIAAQAAAAAVERDLLGDSSLRQGPESLPPYARLRVKACRDERPAIAADSKLVAATEVFAGLLEQAARGLMGDVEIYERDPTELWAAVRIARDYIAAAADAFFAKFAETEWSELGSTARDMQIGAWIGAGRSIIRQLPSGAQAVRAGHAAGR